MSTGAHWCPLVPFFSALPCLATTTIFGYGSLDITAKDGAKTVEEWEFFLDRHFMLCP